MNIPSLNVPKPTASTLVTSSYVKTPPTDKLPENVPFTALTLPENIPFTARILPST